MSNTSALALGLGSGLAFWHLTKSKDRPVSSPASSSSPNAPTPRKCSVRLASTGLTVDGARVDLAEAVRRCEAAGHAAVTVAPNAPASLYAELMTALGAANVPTIRNARTRNTETMTDFTLRYYPEGHKGMSKMRWFRAEVPITWADARDRLIAAGIVDPSVAGRTHERGGWMLSIDKHQFQSDRAEPLPGSARNSHTWALFTLVEFPDGIWGKRHERWFRAQPPTTWDDAYDRLVAAHVLDPSGRTRWKLSTDPARFRADRAEPLPDRTPRARDSSRAKDRYTREGRTILRDGEAILYVDRVDLGDERYAISPYHADLLTDRMVRLLNRHGAR